MAAVVTFILLALLRSGALYLFLRYLRAQASKSVGKDREVFELEAGKYDLAIDAAVTRLTQMRSLDALAALEEQKKEALAEVEVERAKVKKIEGELEVLQQKVDKQEARHNELKRGKEEADRLADEVRSNRERLVAEAGRLEQELVQSKVQMESLSSEITLDSSQEQAVAEIRQSLIKSSTQLTETRRLHELSANRFLSLQTQYSELEKEFRKLVDKELSGE